VSVTIDGALDRDRYGVPLAVAIPTGTVAVRPKMAGDGDGASATARGVTVVLTLPTDGRPVTVTW